MIPSERLGLKIFKRTACSRLKAELLKDGIEIAGPICTRELDMLASVNARDAARPRVWIPIKVLAVRADELSSKLESANAPGLVIARVWNGLNSAAVRTFAFTPPELTVAKMIALIKRANAMRVRGDIDPAFARDTALQEAMKPFTMLPGQWRKKIATML
jgi:hypothetical protein